MTNALTEFLRSLDRIWRRTWFRAETTHPLEVIRAGLGLILLSSYGLISPRLFDLYGDKGWASRDALASLADPWIQSAFFYFSERWQWMAFHALFLFCCTAFALGYRTRWVKWAVLLGHLSYVHRNPWITYGADAIVSALLFVLCLAPIGLALSLDARRRAREAEPGENAAPISEWGFACTRLIQFQMAVVIFFAGVSKLRSETWWSGDAVWATLVSFQTPDTPLDWLSQHYWVINVLTYTTLLIELSFPFLIWGRSTRPFWLAAVIALHLGIAVGLGYYYFSAVVIVGYLSFCRHEWLRRWVDRYSPFDGSSSLRS